MSTRRQSLPRGVLRDFGSIIRDLRGCFGITQQALADAINLSRVNVCELEHGRLAPSLHTIYALARFFRVDAGSLLPTRRRRTNR